MYRPGEDWLALSAEEKYESALKTWEHKQRRLGRYYRMFKVLSVDEVGTKWTIECQAPDCGATLQYDVSNSRGQSNMERHFRRAHSNLYQSMAANYATVTA